MSVLSKGFQRCKTLEATFDRCSAAIRLSFGDVVGGVFLGLLVLKCINCVFETIDINKNASSKLKHCLVHCNNNT